MEIPSKCLACDEVAAIRVDVAHPQTLAVTWCQSCGSIRVGGPGATQRTPDLQGDVLALRVELLDLRDAKAWRLRAEQAEWKLAELRQVLGPDESDGT